MKSKKNKNNIKNKNKKTKYIQKVTEQDRSLDKKNSKELKVRKRPIKAHTDDL